MSTFFRPLIDKRSALVYIVDILLLADEKHEMFEVIQLNQSHQKLKPSKKSHHQKEKKMLCNFWAVYTFIQNSLKNYI